ncbi:MAG: dCMP deaminase family protein [Patescibacteria group bacterium]|nr:dCMP deaminase family protein [Patescibacteria group bacterium]MDD5121004.1 dCMP deaminase family protein [Patescibacteria group bacterium]MDD5221635.1 dCMP deaminase family protein [Patescibacteria group bacterium]MDD5396077.1 dCMP deaminase family protein [Patescibacteria group bacterium]
MAKATKSFKRKNYISWDEYFMGIAILSAMRSKDPNTQTGACIVDKQNKIIGIGYNGFPTGCSDNDFPWTNKGNDPVKTKYFYVCHAELNAILNSHGRDLNDCRIYTFLIPCNECAKAIIQSGIREIIYLSDSAAMYGRNKNTPTIVAALKMFKSAGVKMRLMKSSQSLIINFKK